MQLDLEINVPGSCWMKRLDDYLINQGNYFGNYFDTCYH